MAAWIAHVTFWVLIAHGWMSGDLRIRGAIVASALGNRVPQPALLPYGAALFPSVVAVIDVALVFVIFKGDVHIT
jgi:hypothetical protein